MHFSLGPYTLNTFNGFLRLSSFDEGAGADCEDPQTEALPTERSGRPTRSLIPGICRV